jgi:hypothetical protein
MHRFLPGTIVKINKLSKSSWNLYKKYLKDSPLLICPCHCKNSIFIVIDNFNNGVVLLQIKNNSRLTMTYAQDLEAVYEPKI